MRRPYRSSKSIKLGYTRYAPTIKIGGRVVDIFTARLVYRCEVCLSKLERRRAGLECLADYTHRGFIHRDEAAERQAKEDEKIEKMQAVYEIVDGLIVVKEN